MRKLLLVFAASLLCVAANAGKILTDSLYSSVLGRQMRFNVYLPDGFGRDASERYPSVYLLHGLYGNYTDWNKLGNMKPVADELIGTGEACRMVIIMPDAGGKDIHKVHNGYFNVPGWSYEDFFFSELMPYAESKYNCFSDKSHRAIMGLSMGGGGSAVYAQKYPELFSSCYAISAWLDQPDFDQKGKSMTEDCYYWTCRSVRENSALDYVDKASAAQLDALRGVRWFLDCGDDDFLLQLSMDLHMKMKAAGVKSELRVRNGAHTWEYWHTALRLALPFVSDGFGRQN